MDKKKRFFSAFDLCIILLVILAAGGWLWMNNRAVAEEDIVFHGSPAIYYIEVNNITREQVEQVRVGDNLLEGTRHLAIGQVIQIEVQNFEARVDDWPSQTISIQAVPERYTMILTVETMVEETEREVLTEGGVLIRGGRSISFNGPGYGFAGAVILRIERGA